MRVTAEQIEFYCSFDTPQPLQDFALELADCRAALKSVCEAGEVLRKHSACERDWRGVTDDDCVVCVGARVFDAAIAAARKALGEAR